MLMQWERKTKVLRVIYETGEPEWNVDQGR